MSRAIVWFRRDLRLADNPALAAALQAGHAPVPVYVHAPQEDAPWAPGAASRAWLQRSLASLDADLRRLGSRLLLRCGDSGEELEKLALETGAEAVYWNRLYEPPAVARDARVRQRLQAIGLFVESGNAALLLEPWAIATGNGGPYRVFTPFWKNASRHLDGLRPQPAPAALPPLSERWSSLPLAALRLSPPPTQLRWDEGFWSRWQPGEAGAQELLEVFIEGAAHGYHEQRDFPDRTGTSLLSPHLHFGEISPRQILACLRRQRWPAATEPGITRFVGELGWREFAHHLLYHFPHSSERDFNPRFAGFRWRDADADSLRAWQQGRTGVPIVDAGMRELWQTGWMHNRVRMVVASFLCKNLRWHWRHGASWFWDTLLDADLANNSLGWQWSAGTGADAVPYFRIFNPVAQAERFDRQGCYIRRWLPELASLPLPALFAPWTHGELVRRLAPKYPRVPLVDLKASRDDALARYRGMKAAPAAAR